MTSETQSRGTQPIEAQRQDVSTASATSVASVRRVFSVDVLMGLVLMLLALDYSRDFLSKAQFLPLDLRYTNFPFFMTRWMTHFAAPMMIFLGGIYAQLRLLGGVSKTDLAKFLVVRGLILILIDVFLVSFGWTFSVSMPIMLQVLWVLGASMMLLGGLVLLPFWVAPVLGLVLIGGHNLFDATSNTAASHHQGLFAVLLHGYGRVKLMGHSMFVLYPIVPWVGVMALGYAMGRFYSYDINLRKRAFYLVGGGAVLVFLVLRWINGYGDPDPWYPRDSFLFTVLSFLNTSKFPPSLDYLLMTLGPGMMLLAWLEGKENRILNIPATFGRVVVFFYVAVVYLIHLIAVLVAFLQGYHIRDLLVPVWLYPKAYGLDLASVYGVWLVLLVLMFVLCRWYGMRKSSIGAKLLQYL